MAGKGVVAEGGRTQGGTPCISGVLVGYQKRKRKGKYKKEGEKESHLSSHQNEGLRENPESNMDELRKRSTVGGKDPAALP